MSLSTFNFPAIDNWINYEGDKVYLKWRSDNFKIEAGALRASPESCLIYVNRGQSVVQPFRVKLKFSLPWEVDEYTRAHSRIGFVMEQAGQRFFTEPSAWPHRTNAFDASPSLSVICDSCQTTCSWRSRPGLSLQSNEPSSSSSPSFVFEPGTPLHFGCYLCYWPISTDAALPLPQLLTFQFEFSVDELQIDGWDVIMENRFDDLSRWFNSKFEKNNNLSAPSPQQLEIKYRSQSDILPLVYINQEDQVALGEQASRLQMIFSGSFSSERHDPKDILRIGFVVQQGSPNGPSLKRFFSKKTFLWTSKTECRAQLLVNQHTTWLSALDSKEEGIGTSVVLDGSNQPLFFGFYIHFRVNCAPIFNFGVALFKVVAEYVDHGLEQSITHCSTFLRSRLVPGRTRFIRKSGGGTDEKRVFQGLSLDGEILVSYNADDSSELMTLPAAGGGDEKWEVEQSTYPPCAFYDAEAFEDKPELLSKIFGKGTPRYVSKTLANSGKEPSGQIDV